MTKTRRSILIPPNILLLKSNIQTVSHQNGESFVGPKAYTVSSIRFKGLFSSNPRIHIIMILSNASKRRSMSLVIVCTLSFSHYLYTGFLRTFLDYLTPEQKALLGPIPDTSLSRLWDTEDNDTESNPSDSFDQTQFDNLLSTLLSSSHCLSAFLLPATLKSPPTFNLPRRLQSAIHNQDGPRFLEVMDGINTFFRALKYPRLSPDLFDDIPPNGLISTAKSKGSVPHDVLMRIVDETYQRAVGPEVDSLKNYQAFSAETYGELMPKFVSRIIRETKLNADSLFIDLGSGVGNTVCQVTLETGCKSFGVELLNTPACVAQTQLQQLKIRCKMWGISLGDVELEHNDMLKSKRVDELLSKADVVLVNNKVFDEACASFSFSSSVYQT